MITFDQFKAKWLGNRVDYDRIFRYQCVDLIRQYFYECFDFPGGGGVGSAIHYWTSTPQDVLDRFTKIGNSDGKAGDVVMLWGLPGNEHGHIGIATGGGTATKLEILEQNGETGNGSGEGGDAIRLRYVDRSRVAGLLRPIPRPQPIVYQRTAFSPAKWVRPIQGAKKWNLNYRTFQEVAANPVDHASGEPRLVQAVLVHPAFPEHQYYLEDINQNYGWNTKDAPDYIAPAPKPPAPPITAKPVEYYDIVTSLFHFPTPEKARQREDARGSLDKGRYIVVRKDEHAYQLVKNNMETTSHWVNTLDNKVEVPKPVPVDPPLPTPTPNQPVDIVVPEVEPTDVSDNSLPIPTVPARSLVYDWIRGDREPVVCLTLNANPQTIRDLDNPDTVITASLPPNKEIEFSMMTFKGGVEYYIPTLSLKRGERHGVPKTMLKEIGVGQSRKRGDVNNDGKTDGKDAVAAWNQFIDYSGKFIQDVIVPLKPKMQQATTKIGKTIDGFRRPK